VDLSQRILSYLEQNPNSSAKEIAKFLNVERTVVNSFLYSAKGEIVLKNNDRLPLWRVLKVTTPVENKVRKLIAKNTNQNKIHIDFHGGDWILEIRTVMSSINDPIAEVERIGKRERIISVSDSILSSVEDSESLNNQNDAIIAIAASALVWEIYQDLVKDHDYDMEFDFQAALRDVYLSIAANVLRELK
jgi:DNA-binding Lrp family transcriptional regulator